MLPTRELHQRLSAWQAHASHARRTCDVVFTDKEHLMQKTPTTREEREAHPDTTARPIPSGADPMEYRRPHPPGKPVRDDQSADPPREHDIKSDDKKTR